MRFRCCRARRRASFSSSDERRPLQCGSDDTLSESAGRFREQDGVSGVGEIETMLGLREAGLSDSVHIANVGSKSIVCDAVIDRNEQ